MMKKNYLCFLLSDLLSQFGAGMIMAALSWYVISTFNSNVLVAEVMNMNLLSGLVVSIVVGSFIDNVAPRTMVMLAHLLRILFICLAVGVSFLDNQSHIFLFLVAASNGWGWNIYYPASKSLIRQISNNDGLIKINSITEITMQIGMFSAGAVAGTLYEHIGFMNILYIGISLFVLACLFASLVRTVPTIQNSEIMKESMISHFREGGSYLVQNKHIFLLGIVLYIPFIGSNVFNVAFPGYVSNYLKQDAAMFGLIDMFYGVGACLAGGVVLSLVRKMSSSKIVNVMFIVGIITGILFYVNYSVTFAIFLTLVLGFCGPSIRTVTNTIIMEVVPDTVLGRVMTIWNALSLLVQSLLTFVLGQIMDRYGSHLGFLFYSLLMLVGLLVFSLSKSRRRGRDEDNYNNQPLEG